MIIKSQEFIEQNYREKFSVDELASRFDLTRSTFEQAGWYILNFEREFNA